MVVMLLIGALANCPQGPEPEAVLRRAATLREAGARPVPWTLTFSRVEGSVVLDAALDGQRWHRTLPADANCASLLDAAAVVLLTLEHNLDASAPRTRFVQQRSPGATQAPAPDVDRPWRWTVGIGLGLMVAWPTPQWAALAQGSARREGALLGAAIEARVHAPRQVPLDTGRIEWSRAQLALGPELAREFGSVGVSLLPQAAAGWSWVNVQSPIGVAEFASLDLGARLGLRVTPGRAQVGLHPWLELSVVAWARRHLVILEANGAAQQLPVLDVDLALGVSWGQ